MAQLKGLDLSHHNGDPDFNSLHDHGVQVVYHKATEGKSYVDPKMESRVVAADKAGLHVGVYHFARFESVAGAKVEAENFIDKVKDIDKHIDMPYVLDIEVDDSKLSLADLTKACLAFLEAVKAAFKKPVAVYTYDSFIHANLGKELGQYPLWLADYGDHVLTDKSVWSRLTAIQYTDKGTVIGLNGGVDMDWFDDSMVIRPPAPKPKVTEITHKVVSGDTVSELAAHYNTTSVAIKKLNKLDSDYTIQIGQVLKIK